MLWNIARLFSLAIGGVVAELADVRVVYLASALLLSAAAAIGLTANLSTTSDRVEGVPP